VTNCAKRVYRTEQPKKPQPLVALLRPKGTGLRLNHGALVNHNPIPACHGRGIAERTKQRWLTRSILTG
jgi:hypothetical protein